MNKDLSFAPSHHSMEDGSQWVHSFPIITGNVSGLSPNIMDTSPSALRGHDLPEAQDYKSIAGTMPDVRILGMHWAEL